MIRWAKEVLAELRAIRELLVKIEANTRLSSSAVTTSKSYPAIRTHGNAYDH